MARVIHKSEALASQLSVEAKLAMRDANFNGSGWAIKSSAVEISELLIALKLGRFVKGELVITNVGMAVRAFISRKQTSRLFVNDGTKAPRLPNDSVE